MELGANPAWIDGWRGPLRARHVRPSVDDICVEVERPKMSPLYVTVNVDETPWKVRSVVVFEEGDIEPRVTYQTDANDQPEICRFVLLGTDEPFPDRPEAIDVNPGPAPDVHHAAIQRAIFTIPEAFGIDRSREPSAAVYPAGRSDPPGRICYQLVVYQGGPVAHVALGMTADAGAPRIATVRITEQALRSPAPYLEGEC